jgi:hypothetical protein
MNFTSYKKNLDLLNFLNIKKKFKPIALLPSDSLHHLDHLAPLCHFLNCPLLTQSREIYNEGLKHYPEVEFHFNEFDLKKIASEFNLILVSSKFAKITCETFYKASEITHMRFCFCPHGLSDKEDKLSYESGNQDISLFYGQKQIDAYEAKENFFITGNYRKAYFEKFKNYQNEKASKILCFEKKQKTIFFAPSWDQQQNKSSFKLWKDLFFKLPSTYNLIIKFHPLILNSHAATIFEAIAHNDVKKNVRIISDYCPIYPILDKTDIYLGDYSSIGYDFLSYNRPLFFLADTFTDLQRAGTKVQDIDDFFQKIEIKNESLKEIRNSIYQYSFLPNKIVHDEI